MLKDLFKAKVLNHQAENLEVLLNIITDEKKLGKNETLIRCFGEYDLTIVKNDIMVSGTNGTDKVPGFNFLLYCEDSNRNLPININQNFYEQNFNVGHQKVLNPKFAYTDSTQLCRLVDFDTFE